MSIIVFFLGKLNMNSLSILIPAYNEENTIRKILERILAGALINDIKKEIIVIDDCSTDDTYEIVKAYMLEHPTANIQLKQHAKNKGKGAAIHTGIQAATGDYLIVQDADLEYDPMEFNELFQPVFYDNADVVYGSRFMGSKPHRILFFWHTIGNRILTFLSNMLTNLNLTDMETCYKLFRSDIIKKIDLKENRFGFEPEVTAKIARIPKIKIYEVGISYYGRTYEEGKKINWKDGFRAIYCILRYNIFR